MKKLSAAGVIAGLCFFATGALAHGPEEGYPMGPWRMWWGHGAGWWIFPLVMIAVMVMLCFLFFGRRGGRSPWCGFGERKDAETPLDILKKRYAKGDISKEEFDAIKKDL